MCLADGRRAFHTNEGCMSFNSVLNAHFPRDPNPRVLQLPKGPKIEKIQDRPPGLKFSIEIEVFKRATHQTPIFCGEV